MVLSLVFGRRSFAVTVIFRVLNTLMDPNPSYLMPGVRTSFFHLAVETDIEPVFTGVDRSELTSGEGEKESTGTNADTNFCE